jgi:putative lipoprotein
MRGLMLVFTLGVHAPRQQGADPWFGPDKLQHFFASAFVQSMGYGAVRAMGAEHHSALAGATAGTVVVGVGKELHDRATHGDVSARDLVWDAAGAASATALLVRTAR